MLTYVQCIIYPRSSDPFYKVTYYIKWVTTSWTHSTLRLSTALSRTIVSSTLASDSVLQYHQVFFSFSLFFLLSLFNLLKLRTICPRSSDQFYVLSYYIKWVTTFWTDGTMSPYFLFYTNQIICQQLPCNIIKQFGSNTEHCYPGPDKLPPHF